MANKKKKFYFGPPEDDVEFLRKLEHSHAADIQKLPSQERLIELTQKEGIDIATGVFYLSCFTDPVSRDFVSDLDRRPAKATDGTPKGKILVIPAMFYKEYPEVGGQGPQILEVARRCGFEAEVVPTLSPGPMHENIKILLDTLNNEKSEQVWLMSLSRGSLELRLTLEDYRDQFPAHKVKGWINACGFPSGSSLTDLNLRNWQGRVRWWLIARVMGSHLKYFEQMGEKAHHHKPFPEIPKHFKVINIVPFMRKWHVQGSLMGRFNLLTRYGPNDGIGTTRSGVIAGYPVYPVWATDHFFRNDKVIPFLYRLFRVIGEM